MVGSFNSLFLLRVRKIFETKAKTKDRGLHRNFMREFLWSRCEVDILSGLLKLTSRANASTNIKLSFDNNKLDNFDNWWSQWRHNESHWLPNRCFIFKAYLFFKMDSLAGLNLSSGSIPPTPTTPSQLPSFPPHPLATSGGLGPLGLGSAIGQPPSKPLSQLGTGIGISIL